VIAVGLMELSLREEEDYKNHVSSSTD
jgi:hypothetical protein